MKSLSILLEYMFDPSFSNYGYLLSLTTHPPFSPFQIIRSSNLEALNKVVSNSGYLLSLPADPSFFPHFIS